MSRLLKQISRRIVSSKRPDALDTQPRLSTSVTDEQPLEIFTALPQDDNSSLWKGTSVSNNSQQTTRHEYKQETDFGSSPNCRDGEWFECKPVFDNETQRYRLSEVSTKSSEETEPIRQENIDNDSSHATQSLQIKDCCISNTPDCDFKIQTNEMATSTESVHSRSEMEQPKARVLELTNSLSRHKNEREFVSKTSKTTDPSFTSKMSLEASNRDTCASVDASSAQSTEEQERSLVKRASEELLKLLTDPELADELAVECAEKALQRYISPIMKEQELKVITEAEKALEEELLGLDKNIVQKLPKEIDACLSRRARAVAAAETVARGNGSRDLVSSQHSMSKRSSLQTHASKGSTGLGYADMAELARGVGSPVSDVVSTTFAPHPSQASSLTGSHTQVEKETDSPMKAMLSRRFASFKHLDEMELTAVYDRTYAWLKRSETKVAAARNTKQEKNLKECSFKPTIIQRKPSSLKNSTLQEQDTNMETESTGSLTSTMDNACLRLYEKAKQMHSRKYQRIDDFLYDEQQTLQAASPRARPMPKSIYGDIFPTVALHRGFSSKLRPLPSGKQIKNGADLRSPLLSKISTGIEECTFHPKTNVKRTWTIPNRSRRSSYWNLDNINVTGELIDDFESGGLSKGSSSNIGTVASLGSDLVAVLETNRKAQQEQETNVEENETHDTNCGFTENTEEKTEVRSPEDLMNVFLENLSRSKDLPKSSPISSKTKREIIVHEKGYQSDSKTAQRKLRDRTGERYQLTQFAGECKLMTDVDFTEFLKRQEYYLLLKNRKIQALKNKKGDSVQLSPGTRKILKDKKAQLEAAKSDTGNLIRSYTGHSLDGSVNSYPLSRTQSQKTVVYDKECSFSPKITKKAQRLKPRSIDDFTKTHSKTQTLMEARRLEQEMNEIAQLTFKPKLGNKLSVPSRLNLKDPEAYMASLRERQERRLLKELETEYKREKEELSHCTFHPQITSLPSSMKRDLEQKQRAKQEQVTGALPSWGYATKLQTTSTL